MNYVKNISICILLSNSLSLNSQTTEHTITETKRTTIEQQRFEMRRETKNGVFSETYLINEKPVKFEEYESAYLNAKQLALKKELEEERQHALNIATLEKETRRTAAARILKVEYDELKAAIKSIKNYELEPYLIWSSSTIPSKEDYEYATNQLPKEVETLLQCVEINQMERDKYVSKLTNYAHKLHELFQSTVNTILATTKDTKLLKRLMDIV